MKKFFVLFIGAFFLIQIHARGDDDIAPPSIESQDLAIQEQDAADTHAMAEALTSQEIDGTSVVPASSSSDDIPAPEITHSADREASLWNTDTGARKYKPRYRVAKKSHRHHVAARRKHSKYASKVARHKHKSHNLRNKKIARVLPKKRLAMRSKRSSRRHLASNGY